jgi:carbonic anhydrase/acetyltransferase-like protein (isoleucine patch superfamily)
MVETLPAIPPSGNGRSGTGAAPRVCGMAASDGSLLLGYGAARPQVDADAWVAPGAVVVGDARLLAGSSVWFGAVVRADGDRIELGRGSNLQDGCVMHTDPGFALVVGAGVSVGHRAVLHGCTVEDDVLVGMGAVLLNGSRVGRGSLVAAGAVLLEGTQVPPGSLVAGVPAKVRRELTADELAGVRDNARGYVERAREYAQQGR